MPCCPGASLPAHRSVTLAGGRRPGVRSPWTASSPRAARPSRRSSTGGSPPSPRRPVPTSSSPRAPPGVPKGAMVTHGRRTFARRAWADGVGLRRGRPVPDGQPVLPQLRLPGRHPRLPAEAGDHRSRSRCSTSSTICGSSQAERITVLPGPPTLYYSMLDHPRLADFDLSALRLAVTGAAIVPVALIDRMRAELGFRDGRHRLRPDRDRAAPPPSARRTPASRRSSTTVRAGDPRHRVGHRRTRRHGRCRPARRARSWCAATT